jgi:hypothetical protein
MRWALALAAVAACTRAAPDDALGLHDPNGSGAAECAGDADCVAAASTCCECPSFALPASSGWKSACDAVMCPADAPACDEVKASCDHGTCTLACAAIACDLSCDGGFAIDAAGCQVCACAPPPVANAMSCLSDGDCAEVRADCCGCKQGGADTAVPVAEVAAHDAALMCPTTPACPGVDVCVPGAAPRCDRGTCVLSDAAPGDVLPPGACGRPDLPACPTGLRCLLNASADAAMAGVGVCAP